LFLLAWLTFAVAWFHLYLIGSQLKKLVKKQDGNIRFEYGISSMNRLSSQRLVSAAQKMMHLFFSFGSYDSVSNYLAVFIDIEAVYTTEQEAIVSRMEKLIKKFGLAIKACWVMIISWLSAWFFWDLLA
jgi:hypothetical protein